MCIVLSASLFLSSIEAKSFLAEEDTVANVQPFMLFEPFGILNPNHNYLDDGASSLEQLSSETKARITATTYASQTVDSIGITFILQRWTGSTWVDATAAVERSTTNRDSYTSSVTWNVTEGYYYRAKTIHWIQQGTTYEQGERISYHILIGP